MDRQLEILSSSQVQFITLFSLQVRSSAAAAAAGGPLTSSHRKLVKLRWAKTIFLSQTGTFSLFFIQFDSVGSNIPSTAGDDGPCG